MIYSAAEKKIIIDDVCQIVEYIKNNIQPKLLENKKVQFNSNTGLDIDEIDCHIEVGANNIWIGYCINEKIGLYPLDDKEDVKAIAYDKYADVLVSLITSWKIIAPKLLKRIKQQENTINRIKKFNVNEIASPYSK